MESEIPTAKSTPSREERQRLQRIVERRGLCGLANDTKWDEFISAMRALDGWRPQNRVKCIDAAPSMGRRVVLPPAFSLISVEWLDISFLQESREPRLPRVSRQSTTRRNSKSYFAASARLPQGRYDDSHLWLQPQKP
jgi:hypothetical protein